MSAKGKRILRSVEAPSGRSSAALSPRGNCLSRFFSRAHAPLALSRAHSSIFPLSRVARRSRRSAAAPSARSNDPFSRLSPGCPRGGSARPVSRPVINKSIALLSHSSGALHLRHFHNRTRGRAGRCEREATEEAWRKKGEERCFPPSRIGKSVLPLGAA